MKNSEFYFSFLAGAGTIIGCYTVYSYIKNNIIKKEIPSFKRIDGLKNIESDHESNEKNGVSSWDKYIIDEQQARNIAFLGDEGVEKLRNSFVIVVGAGGVGSWVVTMLARSGIGKIRIIDFDQVTLSSLNRHANATLADVGTPKVNCIAKRVKQIIPWIEIETFNELWNMDNADRLLSSSDSDNKNPTIIVDAIDNIDTKVDLLTYCYNKKLKVISAMGAACKSDPTRIAIGDISSSSEDPLSRATRRRLRLRGIITGIAIVYSTEKPDPRKANLLPLPEDSSPSEIEMQENYGKNADEFAILPDFRARILPVLGYMPGIFGLSICSYIITTIGEYCVAPEYVPARERNKFYESVLQTAQKQALLLEGRKRIAIDINSTGYLVEEVFRGRSVISGESTRLALTKWDPKDDRLLCVENAVLMTKSEAAIHTKEILSGNKTLEELYSPEIISLVNRRFREERNYARWR